MKLFLCFILFLSAHADLLGQSRNRGATLKPISACCDIPELGDPKPLLECSNPKLPGPCNDVQCVFEKSGFLTNKHTLNKEAYKSHLRHWAENHKGWSDAIEKAITDCVDADLRQYLGYPCRAYDVFTCTGIAMLKVITSQGPPPPGLHHGIPEKCTRPPPGVEKPQDCCPVTPLFTPEELAGCGFEKIDPKQRQRPPASSGCSKQQCLLQLKNLVNEDGTMNYDSMRKFMDVWVESNTEFKDTIEKTKAVCTGEGGPPGPPGICEADKLMFCIWTITFTECPVWQDTPECKLLKDHMNECQPPKPPPS